METWKDIPGYEGRYQASDLGRVRSVDHYVVCGFQGKGQRLVRGRVLKDGPCTSGHRCVVLGKGNTQSVHTVVMLAFRGPPPPRHEVLHRDHTPWNNALGNLKYGTRSENLKMDYAAGTRRIHPNFNHRKKPDAVAVS